MSSAASGYKLSLGADGPPGSYQDLDRADGFLVIGANMAECHPILFQRLLDRRKRGARLIVVDPRLTPTAAKADLFLRIKPGTDLALLNGLLHLLEEAGCVDAAFISFHTEGWEELRELLKVYTPSRVASITGLREAALRTAARWIAEAAEFTTLWTMGLNQSTHGTWHTNAICNLHLATGKICRSGSGPFSLTGQPNANPQVLESNYRLRFARHFLPTPPTAVSTMARQGFVILPAVVTDRVRPGNCFAPIHWNDQFGEHLAVNSTTSEAVDAVSLQPEFKFTAVSLAKVRTDLLDNFTPEQKVILQDLLVNVSRNYQANGHGVPTLPEAAPFTISQRRHINQLIAQLCAGGRLPENF